MDTIHLPEKSLEILVVEDSETQAEQLAHLLSSNGYKVRIARDGREALALVHAAKPALIVSDIAMPEMDGFEMCRTLKKDEALRDIPVILLTALSSLYDVIKGLDCGADNFIRKPFEGKSLLGRIRFILANREFRSNDRVQLGMRINLGGQTHFVTAERQQIFDLLISTYEEAIQMTDELRLQQTRIAHSYQSLEGLYKIAEALNPALSQDEVAELALERALDLPGVLGGCIKLLDGQGRFHLAAARDFEDSPHASGEGACTCRQKLLAGEMPAPLLIENCALQGKTDAHVSIPLAVGKRVLGLLSLAVADTSSFEDDDLQVLETVGRQIAVALERADLYANMERLVVERTQALEKERNRLSAIVNTTGALVVVTDLEGRIQEFNPACEQSLGWKFNEVKGRPYWEVFLSQEHAPVERSVFHDQVSKGQPFQVRQEWIDRNGELRTIIWSVAMLKGSDDAVERVLGTGIDVTELRRAEEKVQYLSNFDVLTGLPNRVLLSGQARLAQERAISGKAIMGLMAISFSRLAAIRENLGSDIEQNLLMQVAQRLKSVANGGDAVARFGEHSFALLAVRPKVEDLSAIAHRLLAVLEAPFLIAEQELHMDVGIGIAVYPNDGKEFDLLCQGAETAMRRAVERKTERYEFYRPALNDGARERFKLESELRRALAQEEFVLYYQPQVSLSTGKIIGVEALLRWQHPELGLIAPGRFIGLAEETGLVLPIGNWVLRQSCEQMCAWLRAGVPVVPVAVNLSAKQFSSSVAETVRGILEQTGLDPRLIELELTESLSMEDPESTVGILVALKKMGVGLAIDDFGTGYSNLNYLKRFPVDRLKLDQSFVRDLTSDPDDLAIARAVISMAHSLRLTVIAEGVETEGQLAVLAQNGCDEVQGYFFSHPVDADACAKQLKEGKALPSKCLPVKRQVRTSL